MASQNKQMPQALLDALQGRYRYNTTLPESPPEERLVQDIPEYAGISPEQAAASGMEVSPTREGRYATPEGATFAPEEVEFTPEGKYRVKNWGQRVGQQWGRYPMVKKRTWDMGTDANIKKTTVEPPLDITKVKDVQKGTNILIGAGEKPSEHGFPNVAEAAKLPGEMARTERQGQGTFKDAVAMRRAFNAIGVQYDPKRHYNDQLNEVMAKMPEEQRGEALQKMNEVLKAPEKKTGVAATNLNAIKSILDEKYMSLISKDIANQPAWMQGEPEVKRLHLYKNLNDAQRKAYSYILLEAQKQAGELSPAEAVNNALESYQTNRDMVQGEKKQKTESKPVQQAGNKMSKSGRPMIKDPNSPSGWSYAQ